MEFQGLDEDAELIPLLTPEDEQEMDREELPETLAVLPLRNTVLFPGVVIPITAGRDRSINLIKDANNGSKTIGVVSQKDEQTENPGVEDINTLGTVARILRVLQMPDGNTTVIIQGKKRFQIEEVISEKPYFTAKVKEAKEIRPHGKSKEFEAIIDSIKELAYRIIKDNPNIPSEAPFAIKNIQSDSFLINFVSSNLNLSVAEKQQLLEIPKLQDRALATLKYMNMELQKLELRNDIQSKVRSDMDQQQREYFLHQQMKTIQEELGGISYEEEVDEMREKAKAKKWDEQVAEHFEKELAKMQRMNPQVAEYSIQRNYLDLILDLPWNEFSKDRFDLKRAQKILDRDHYGLEDVKRRILEYLAVLKLRNDMKSPILCLYGPPGVGKTSLGKSVAEALGREYVRMSLGGLRDEAEIRGHRKTYIGAMPGRIVQSLKKAGTSNPVFILDEIDKLANSHQGDPSSAMLEVLDPEQNNDFHDNFLEVGYDLSKVMFVTTANTLSTIPRPLLDRMEVIQIPGYMLDEKIEIARRYRVPRQLKDHGLAEHLEITDGAVKRIVTEYTREAGVRNLDRLIAKAARKMAKEYLSEPWEGVVTVDEVKVRELLGVPPYRDEQAEKEPQVGLSHGLAWTSVGGVTLDIEAVAVPGKGKVTLTGQLGDVMKESAQAGIAYLRKHSEEYGIAENFHETRDLHVHILEGATPKDGPSAGIAMASAVVSALTGRKLRGDVAMTGEITLRGKVLPIGGVKEKLLAAHLAGIKTVILPEANEANLEEVPDAILQDLKVITVSGFHEVLDVMLVDDDADPAAFVPPVTEDPTATGVPSSSA